MGKANRREPADTCLVMKDYRIHTAYHEAGHVVVAYWYGWWLNEEGVDIDERWYAGIRRPALLNTTEACVVTAMAGWIAEHKYHRLGDGRFDTYGDAIELLGVARRIHRGEEILDEEWEGDPMDIAMVLVREKPAITDNEYIGALRAYQKKTWLILNKPAVWRALKKVAEALLEAGRLTDAQARAAVEGEDIFGKGSTQTLLDEGLDADSVRKIAEALRCADS